VKSVKSPALPGFALALFFAVLLAGCGGKKQARVTQPPPPPITPQQHPENPPRAQPAQPGVQPEEETLSIPAGAKPIATETGLASWYGPPYHNRRGSNGELYNMNAMTAAHRTLPLGSIVRVTNQKTGQSALVRITDRGPFIPGRVLDLSLAAAKKLDVQQAGTAMVLIEVMQASAPLENGGRWAVQIGAFDDEKSAATLANHLTRRYHTAKVSCFSSPTGNWWVRVRVLDDDRKRAQEVVHDTQTPQGSVFLVRLD
jgi:rare lipoprotein A